VTYLLNLVLETRNKSYANTLATITHSKSEKQII